MCFSRFYSELIPIVVIELERKISCYSICIVKFNNDESKSISVCKYHDLKLYKKHADKSVVLCRPQDWVEVGSQPNGGQGPIHFILKDAGWISYVIWTSRSKEKSLFMKPVDN